MEIQRDRDGIMGQMGRLKKKLIITVGIRRACIRVIPEREREINADYFSVQRSKI